MLAEQGCRTWGKAARCASLTRRLLTPLLHVRQERHLAMLSSQRGQQQRNLGTGFTLLYGGLAGVAAETAVYPLQIVQRHMQVHSAAGAASGQSCACVNCMRNLVSSPSARRNVCPGIKRLR